MSLSFYNGTLKNQNTANVALVTLMKVANLILLKNQI